MTKANYFVQDGIRRYEGGFTVPKCATDLT